MSVCLAATALLAACRREAEKPAPALQADRDLAKTMPKAADSPAEKVLPSEAKELSPKALAEELGPPLVESADDLKRLAPNQPLWVDRKRNQVVMVGAVCKQVGPLELFACVANSKEYESVVAVDVTPLAVQAGLLALGAEPGNPAQFAPEYVAPRGPVVEVIVIWKDRQGRRQRDRAQSWVRRSGSQEAMDQPWVFTGSRFFRPEESGKEIYAANLTGDLICVSNFADSVLDVPVPSTQEDSALLYEAFTERIPPRGTPVTILLQPKLERAAREKPKGTF